MNHTPYTRAKDLIMENLSPTLAAIFFIGAYLFDDGVAIAVHPIMPAAIVFAQGVLWFIVLAQWRSVCLMDFVLSLYVNEIRDQYLEHEKLVRKYWVFNTDKLRITKG